MTIPRSLAHHTLLSCPLLLLLLLYPAGAFAQKGEMTFTTKSPEALKLFLDGLDKLQNVEGPAAAPMLERAISDIGASDSQSYDRGHLR